MKFTLTLEEARQSAAGDSPQPWAIESAITERNDAMRDIMDRAMSESRLPLASEQRDLDAIEREIRTLDQLAAYAKTKREQQRANEARRIKEARAPIAHLLFGEAPSRNHDEFGEAIRSAAAEVISGQRSGLELNPAEFRSITEGGDGGAMVPVDLKAPGLTLRAKTVMLRLPGVQVMTVRSDRVRVPRLGESTVYGTAEAATLTEDTPDIDAVDVVIQKFSAYSKITNEMIDDAEAPALALIGTNLIEAVARKLDAGFLQGTGAADVVGIRNTVGINTTSVAGTPADFDKFSDAIYEAELDNAEPRAWVMHPRTWNTASKIKTGISSDKTTLLEPNPQERGRTLLDLPVFTSTQITLTEGATNVGSWAAALDPSQLIICERKPATVELSRERWFDEDVVGIRVVARYGLGVLNPEGVSILTDIRA